MLDSSNPSETPVTAAWRDRLAHGDVVLFRFPLAGPAAPHRPVPPPCLVLGVEIIRGRYCAVLAPAMPSCRTSAPGRRVVVDRRPGWRAAGPERAQSRDRQPREAVRGRDFMVGRRNIRRPLPLVPVAADRNGT